MEFGRATNGGVFHNNYATVCAPEQNVLLCIDSKDRGGAEGIVAGGQNLCIAEERFSVLALTNIESMEHENF